MVAARIALRSDVDAKRQMPRETPKNCKVTPHRSMNSTTQLAMEASSGSWSTPPNLPTSASVIATPLMARSMGARDDALPRHLVAVGCRAGDGGHSFPPRRARGETAEPLAGGAAPHPDGRRPALSEAALCGVRIWRVVISADQPCWTLSPVLGRWRRDDDLHVKEKRTQSHISAVVGNQ